jgi:hypothetical protein
LFLEVVLTHGSEINVRFIVRRKKKKEGKKWVNNIAKGYEQEDAGAMGPS